MKDPESAYDAPCEDWPILPREQVSSKSKSPQCGWVVTEIIGMGVVNPRGVAVGRKTTPYKDFWADLEGKI